MFSPLRILSRRRSLPRKVHFCTGSSKKKVCIVGSGPAGFYTAQHLLKNKNTEVDIYEKLPIPFGLIRYGVAPDHPEIKNVINTFTKIALDERCSFHGNVHVGQEVTVTELLKAYDAVVLAYGADMDKKLGIPGEYCKNVWSARTFVGWYNGLPENVNEEVDLDTDVAAVIGQGNVALDVARVLLRKLDELKTTDVSEHAFERLKKSRIKRVVMIGRRGPLQVAFTVKELREMTKLSGCRSSLDSKDFEGVAELISSVPRPRKRLTELLLDTSTKNQSSDEDVRTWELRFFRSPKAIQPDSRGRVEKLCLGINKLGGSQENPRVVETGEEEMLNCGLVLRSVGYQSTTIDSSVPFDPKRNIIPNVGGKAKEGLYCSGWVKSGPVGVILSTMNSSYETGETILRDLEHVRKESNGRREILELLQQRGARVTTFDHWLEINRVELERGKTAGKSRQKICSLQEMLKIAGLV